MLLAARCSRPVLITPERIAVLQSYHVRRLPVGSLSTRSPTIIGATVATTLRVGLE